jgi:serine/threonine-protein kinase
VLALLTLGYVGLNVAVSIWLHRISFNRSGLPFLVATAAFFCLWLLLCGTPRTPRFVRVVEQVALFVGTGALSSIALVTDLTASPDMIARSATGCVLLVYAVYVPSTARHTLKIAALMTVPLLGSIFIAFRAWDPLLHDPPAAIWPKGHVGDMAYPATLVSAVLWGITVAMAASFSKTVHGLRRAVDEVRRLGQYTLEQKLGEGGMGVVYRASHAMLRRPTAIKLLLPERAGKDAQARFEREVRRTAMLTHPNTITVFDYGSTTDGVFYYAMELLEGASLDEIVEVDGPQPHERVIHLLEQVAGSLAEAHEAGLIHRDIKPANIMVVDRGGISDLVKVVDFGLVKDSGALADNEQGAQPALTLANTITGTPLYMAPESLTAPETIDARADLYALGMVGYWLLTGTHVFDARTVVELCAHHLYSVPEPPSARTNVPVPGDLEAIILACLAKQPDERPRSAYELRQRLLTCTGAGSWTNERAAQWWATHRCELRFSGARANPASPKSQVAITRVFEQSALAG